MNNKANFKTLLAIAMIFILSISLFACTQPQKGAQAQIKPLEKLTILLDWTPNTNHTGLFVARDKGYYKDAGLDVTIMSADGGNGLEMISGGKGDLAISFEESLSAARVAQPPLPVKAIATILQKNTSGFASLKGKNILTAKDMEGKVYGSWGTDIETAFLKAVMKKNNADFSKLKIKTVNALDSLTMIEKEADLAWIYYGWDGISAEVLGKPINFMLLSSLDKELEFYSPLIAASDKTIKEKPEQLKKFILATKKGYEFAAKNPKEAAQLLFNANKDLNLNMLIKSQEYLAKYLLDDNGNWGIMKDTVWQNFSKWLFENKVVNKLPKSDELYTNEFFK